MLIHAIDFLPKFHEFTKFLRSWNRGRRHGRCSGCRNRRSDELNCGLLENYVEPGVGRHGDADVLRIRGVRQFLLARQGDVAGQAVPQKCLAGNGAVQATPATHDNGATGDNGTATSITSRMGDRTIQGGKGNTTDAGTHVPFIASWPGTIKPGQVSDALIDFTDFLPTLLDAAGTKPPENLSLDGHSFLPVLKGTDPATREWIYCWYARDGGAKAQSQFAASKRYKLTARVSSTICNPIRRKRAPCRWPG